jgi:serine phosphatase RsbU (regulator of sigma subunit)
MLTGVVKSAFRSARDDGFDPLAVVERLWGALPSFGDERFVTLVAGVVDVKQGTMEYVNAGHPAPFLWRDGAPPSTLPATGPLISAALPGLLWVRERIAFPAGTRLLLYTDGVTEACGEGGDFGSAGIAHEIGRTPAGGTHLLDAVLDALARHGRGRPQEDDWTMLTASV